MDDSRGSVQYATFSEVISDIDSLARNGYRRLGLWSLGQACVHLSSVMRACIEGFPTQPRSTRVPLWLCRNTIARFPRGRVALTRLVTGSISTFPEMVPPPGVDDADGIAELKRWIAHTEAHQGPFEPSPSLGRLSAQEITALHLAHCAHHLGFLLSQGDSA
jgi:hypothetical protein